MPTLVTIKVACVAVCVGLRGWPTRATTREPRATEFHRATQHQAIAQARRVALRCLLTPEPSLASSVGDHALQLLGAYGAKVNALKSKSICSTALEISPITKLNVVAMLKCHRQCHPQCHRQLVLPELRSPLSQERMKAGQVVPEQPFGFKPTSRSRSGHRSNSLTRTQDSPRVRGAHPDSRLGIAQQTFSACQPLRTRRFESVMWYDTGMSPIVFPTLQTSHTTTSNVGSHRLVHPTASVCNCVREPQTTRARQVSVVRAVKETSPATGVNLPS